VPEFYAKVRFSCWYTFKTIYYVTFKVTVRNSRVRVTFNVAIRLNALSLSSVNTGWIAGKTFGL